MYKVKLTPGSHRHWMSKADNRSRLETAARSGGFGKETVFINVQFPIPWEKGTGRSFPEEIRNSEGWSKIETRVGLRQKGEPKVTWGHFFKGPDFRPFLVSKVMKIVGFQDLLN
jgi:hypothetical protein